MLKPICMLWLYRLPRYVSAPRYGFTVCSITVFLGGGVAETWYQCRCAMLGVVNYLAPIDYWWSLQVVGKSTVSET